MLCFTLCTHLLPCCALMPSLFLYIPSKLHILDCGSCILWQDLKIFRYVSYKHFHYISMYFISTVLTTVCIMDNCPISVKSVLQHDKTLLCSCCCKYTHRICRGLSKAQYDYVRFNTSWYCEACIGGCFSFQSHWRWMYFLESDKWNISKLWGGVLLLTQACVLLKGKSTQLHIFILRLFYPTKVRDFSKFLLSCELKVNIKQGKSTFY